MKIHISKDTYINKVRARGTEKLISDLLNSQVDVDNSQFIKYLIDGYIVIPCELSNIFTDMDNKPLLLAREELEYINVRLNKHSNFNYKDINFTKAILKRIMPDNPFIINHRICWSSQSIFIITVKDKSLIEKAKTIGLAFWYESLYPEKSYNLVFFTDNITDYRIAYLINSALYHFFKIPNTISNSNLTNYFYGCKNHSGFKNINNKLSVLKLLQYIQYDLFKIDPSAIYSYSLAFESKVRLQHCYLETRNKVFHIFAANDPKFFNHSQYYAEYNNIGFMFLHTENESKHISQITVNSIKNLPYCKLNFKLPKEYINIPLKSARQCCPLINDLLNKDLSQELINIVVSNIRYFSYGITELLNHSSQKEQIYWALSHIDEKLSCELCPYKCKSLNIYSHLLSLNNNYLDENDFTKNLPVANNINYDSDKRILLQLKDPLVDNNIKLKDNEILFTKNIPNNNYSGIVQNNISKNISLNNVIIDNLYMPFIVPKLKPKIIYLDDNFIFQNLIKIYKIPNDEIIPVKNLLLNSELDLTIKDKVLLLFNQLNNLKKLAYINVQFYPDEINQIISILKNTNFHKYWNYLFRENDTFLFKEFNLFSLESYTLYFFYFNKDIFNWPCNFRINVSYLNQELWTMIMKNCGIFDFEFREIQIKLPNVYLHPKYSYSFSRLKKIKYFNKTKEYKYIHEFLKDNSVIITHHDLYEYFIQNGFTRVSSNLHFNSLNKTINSPITIIGTPRLKEVYYYSLALLTNLSINELNKVKFGSYKVAYKGVSFPIRSYSNNILNTIMLSQIESEFKRLISLTDKEVHIFSNFYLPGAIIDF